MTIPTDEDVVNKALESFDARSFDALTPLLFGCRVGFAKGAEWMREKMLPEIESLQKLVRECQDRIKVLDSIVEAALMLDVEESTITRRHES
jgi:hypothetical protein